MTPFGAKHESLADRTVLERFIKHNCKRLNKLASLRSSLGRAHMYFVTGCVKSSSWAVAAYTSPERGLFNAHEQASRSIVLQNVAKATSLEPNPEFCYRWTSKPDGTEAHCGPETLAQPSDPRTQCLFLSGYRLGRLEDPAPANGHDDPGVNVCDRDGPNGTIVNEKGGSPPHLASTPAASTSGTQLISTGTAATASQETHRSSSPYLCAFPQAEISTLTDPGQWIGNFLTSVACKSAQIENALSDLSKNVSPNRGLLVILLLLLTTYPISGHRWHQEPRILVDTRQ
ncbi:hypothetical protein FA15DRAFT_634887, partial [Coprinopsis marcescibilis]